MTSPTSKTQAREEALGLVRELGADFRRKASASIRSAIENWNVFREARRVMLFAGLNGEPALLELLISGRGTEFCLPKVVGKSLEVYSVSGVAELGSGKFGILEPNGDGSKKVSAGEIDLVLVPGVAFSETGQRVGKGGGFFDRFLPQLAPGAVIAGVCFQCQVFPTVPVEPHDVPVDFVISEGGISRCPRS